jgi:hypothetical protein
MTREQVIALMGAPDQELRQPQLARLSEKDECAVRATAQLGYIVWRGQAAHYRDIYLDETGHVICESPGFIVI